MLTWSNTFNNGTEHSFDSHIDKKLAENRNFGDEGRRWWFKVEKLELSLVIFSKSAPSSTSGVNDISVNKPCIFPKYSTPSPSIMLLFHAFIPSLSSFTAVEQQPNLVLGKPRSSHSKYCNVVCDQVAWRHASNYLVLRQVMPWSTRQHNSGNGATMVVTYVAAFTDTASLMSAASGFFLVTLSAPNPPLWI